MRFSFASVIIFTQAVSVFGQGWRNFSPPSGDFPTQELIANFLLSDYRTASAPLATFLFYNDSGLNTSATWAETADMGPVINCQANESDYITVNDVEFGTEGPFAFNTWIQQRNNNGSAFQYILSAAPNHDAMTNTSIFEPNQVHIYLPDADHPAGGLVRSVIKDVDDQLEGIEDETFLDSDGFISSDNNRSTPRLHLNDGSWHQIAISTLPGAPATRGYSIYVDGQLMASLNETTADGYFNIDGGRPMNTTGSSYSITLCGRSDHASERFFDGLLTQFSVFNDSLTSEEVADLYRAVMHEDPPPVYEVAAPVPVAIAEGPSIYAAAPTVAAAVAASPLSISILPLGLDTSSAPAAAPLPVPVAAPSSFPSPDELFLPVISIDQPGSHNDSIAAGSSVGNKDQSQDTQHGHIGGWRLTAAVVLAVLLVVTIIAISTALLLKRGHLKRFLLGLGFRQEFSFQRGIDLQ